MDTTSFLLRHVGHNVNETKQILSSLGVESLEEFIKQVVPEKIRLTDTLGIEAPMSEIEFLNKVEGVSRKNEQFRSLIGQGYYGTATPSVIIRNILENPSWYTSYTPYQAEISQGRLESLMNFQTMVSDLTGLEIANASLLDEATAAAEAMIMLFNARSRDAVKKGVNKMFVDNHVFRHTKDVVETRAHYLNIEIVYGNWYEFHPNDEYFAVLIQYPDALGEINDYEEFVASCKEKSISVAVCADLLSLVILTPPGEWGADVAIGSTQRFGLPMSFGGPHAGFFATKSEYARKIPGRIIGESVDADGNKAYRMALQTREQHIKRERATSNICTAQALLANMSAMYAVYHGKEGLQDIAVRIKNYTQNLYDYFCEIGLKIKSKSSFSSLTVYVSDDDKALIKKRAEENKINFFYSSSYIHVSIDELTNADEINLIKEIFIILKNPARQETIDIVPKKLLRKSDFLTAEVFQKYRTETELMRYIKRLEKKDYSLTDGMIPLGSCTMKLNAATEMLPISWSSFYNIHPFAPKEQTEGYLQIIGELEADLAKITGFDAISLQPNSGASGEYAGLLAIRGYLNDNGGENRNIVLIPASAHGTNPASAVMAGMQTITVKCDDEGNINIEDLKNKAEEYKDTLAAFMVTYPSTHGVFEEDIMEMNQIIHNNGGLVYMDGANMNAQVGLTNPAKIGADVCHLNLHKTFAIPHGGGGPGIGPIGVVSKLIPYLPSHNYIIGKGKTGAVSASPYGSALILIISYAYIKMLGEEGLKKATEFAILNANYLATELSKDYKVLYTGKNNRVAHEMILDFRMYKEYGIEVIDIAKRLMDYGFHAPTVSFPVAGTLMVEPTESESLYELDRFIVAMRSIKTEILQVVEGKIRVEKSLLKNAPHTLLQATATEWQYEYSREQAVYPVQSLYANKYWATCARINDAYGDRNLVCSCN